MMSAGPMELLAPAPRTRDEAPDSAVRARKPVASRRGRRRRAKVSPQVDPRTQLELIWRAGLHTRILETLPSPDPLPAKRAAGGTPLLRAWNGPGRQRLAFHEADEAEKVNAIAAQDSRLAPAYAFRATLSPRQLRQHFIRWLRRNAHCCVSCGTSLNREGRSRLGLELHTEGGTVSVVSVPAGTVPALRVGDVIQAVTRSRPHPFRPELELRRACVGSLLDLGRAVWEGAPHGPLVLHVRRQSRTFDVSVWVPKNCTSCRDVDTAYRENARAAPPAKYADEHGRPMRLHGAPKMLPIIGPRFDGSDRAWPECAHLSSCLSEIAKACAPKEAPGASCPKDCATRTAIGR